MRGARVTIDREACRGSAVCVRLAPRTFVLDAQGKARVAEDAPDPEEAVRRAVHACPRFALQLVEIDP